LEQENIDQKHWTLMGEATSRSRPLNSLLEEDLEFEHASRAAPVITEEKVKSIEDLIKARIAEVRKFQDFNLQLYNHMFITLLAESIRRRSAPKSNRRQAVPTFKNV
jgi:U3 small nucleolar ribonucleoprotein component